MAQNFLKDNPGYKMKILDDGSVKLTKKREKSLLKNGVITNMR